MSEPDGRGQQPDPAPVSGLPLVQELRVRGGAASWFEWLRGRLYAFLLESSLLVEGLGRSIMGADPFLVLRRRGGQVRTESDGKSNTFYGDPLAGRRRLPTLYRLPPGSCSLLFAGGADGCFGYDRRPAAGYPPEGMRGRVGPFATSTGTATAGPCRKSGNT